MQAPNDQTAVEHFGDVVYFRGSGFEADGRRPFLDRIDVTSLATVRVFQSALEPLETVLSVLDSRAKALMILRQSPTLPPNVYLRLSNTFEQLTDVVDPTPIVRQISRRVVNYTRPDGVKLSFTLYLPPGYKKGRACRRFCGHIRWNSTMRASLRKTPTARRTSLRWAARPNYSWCWRATGAR